MKLCVRSALIVWGLSVVNILKPGDIIYLDKKHHRADKEHIVHVVRGGESMYSISQKYGIRLKNLYKMNKMKPEDPSPKVGDILRLR